MYVKDIFESGEDKCVIKLNEKVMSQFKRLKVLIEFKEKTKLQIVNLLGKKEVELSNLQRISEMHVQAQASGRDIKLIFRVR